MAGFNATLPGRFCPTYDRDDGALTLRTSGHNDPGRYKIKFDNNQLGVFMGDDSENQAFDFYTNFSSNRSYDATIKVHGHATADWGKYIELTHDGTDGIIRTDAGDLSLMPAVNVGIGTNQPTSKLDVAVGQSGFITANGNGNFGFKLVESGTEKWEIYMQGSDDDFALFDATGARDAIVVRPYLGYVGIGYTDPVEMLHVGGKIRTDGITGLSGGLQVRVYQNTLYYYSASARNMRDISDYSDDFGKILQVRPISAIDNTTGLRQIGYTAEDFVASGLGNLVINNGKGQPEAIDYNAVQVYMMEFVKEQAQEISRIKTENETLRQSLSQLEGQLRRLEDRVR